jgi:hypothetical protein
MRYNIGEKVSGIFITCHEHKDSDSHYHKYGGVWTCCGKPVTITHKTLSDRVLVGRAVCRACARDLGLGKPNPSIQKEGIRACDKDYGVQLPNWKPTTAGLSWNIADSH